MRNATSIARDCKPIIFYCILIFSWEKLIACLKSIRNIYTKKVVIIRIDVSKELYILTVLTLEPYPNVRGP